MEAPLMSYLHHGDDLLRHLSHQLSRTLARLSLCSHSIIISTNHCFAPLIISSLMMSHLRDTVAARTARHVRADMSMIVQRAANADMLCDHLFSDIRQ